MFRRLRSFWRAFSHRSEFEHDMDDEVRFHLESRVDALVKSGAEPADAMRRARLEFGNPEAYQDLCRESRRLHLIDDLILDLRFALRTMRRDAALSVTVVLTLALGIGATTAIFSVVNGVLLRPLPYPDPDRLMMAGSLDSSRQLMPWFGPDYVEWRNGCQVCEEMAAHAGAWPSNLTGGSEPVRVRIARVTASLFQTMGVRPMLGRTFLPGETGRPLFGANAQSTPATAVILGYGLWQRRFGADRSIVGRTVTVEGDSCTVVGVMPAGFQFPEGADAWVPVSMNTKRDNAYLRVIARLRPGVAPAQAQATLESFARRIVGEVGNRRSDTRVRVLPLQEVLVGDVRSSLLMFMGAVGFVLLIACANVASLLLAQAASRPKELAVRAALGARQSRIVRQLLTESLLLSMVGGGLGLILAEWLLRAIVAFGPADIPRLENSSIDRWVLGFTLIVSMLTGLVFGLAPVRRASKLDLNESLQDGGGRPAGNLGRGRTPKLIVVGEVSLALVLLIGAGLLVKSFQEIRQTATGFDPSGTLVASVTLPDAVYPTTARTKAYYRHALERLGALRDARAAGVVNALPLSPNGTRISGDLIVEGESSERPGIRASKLAVGGRYFEATGIPLVRGRFFDDRDTETSSGAVIVSESLARALWPYTNPIGRRLNIGFKGEAWREVVGVVGDVRQDAIVEAPSLALYQPYLQVADSRRWLLSDMTFVVRTAGAPDAFAATLRATLAQVDKDLPLYDVFVMTDVVMRQSDNPRFYALLLGSFSLLALVLAAAGIYGLLAYSVRNRRHEIGIRIALGARARDVLAMVVGEGMTLVLAGSILGIADAFAVTRLLSRFLYGVSATDRGTFVVVAFLLTGVALLACYVPARRATQVDPIVALRHE